jgi:hypothetical protein
MNEDTSKSKFITSFAKFLQTCYCLTLLVELPENSGGRIRFPLLISYYQGSPFSCITWGMKNRPVGGRSSETLSHPIGIKVWPAALQLEGLNPLCPYDKG